MSHTTANIHDCRDDMEFYDDPEYGPRLFPKKPKREVLQNGHSITVPMMLLDAATSPSTAPSDLAPKVCSFVDTATEGGKAWLERGRLQQEAWKTCSYDAAPQKRKNSGFTPATSVTHHPKPAPMQQSLASLQAERDRAYEERGEMLRNAWRNP